MYSRIGVILIAGLILISPMLASAQNPYGLSWAVSVGDEFYYQIDLVVTSTNFPQQTISKEIIVTVEYLGDLSIPSVYPQIAQVNVTYANGSIIPYQDPIYGYAQMIIIFPIGNWTHFTYLFEAQELPEPEQSIYFVNEDFTSWSLKYEYWSEGNMNNYTFSLSKSDGVMNSLSYFVKNEYIQDDEVMYRHTATAQITRLGLVPSILIPTVSAIVVVVEIIIVIEIVRRYRGRKVVADPLTLQ